MCLLPRGVCTINFTSCNLVKQLPKWNTPGIGNPTERQCYVPDGRFFLLLSDVNHEMDAKLHGWVSTPRYSHVIVPRYTVTRGFCISSQLHFVPKCVSSLSLFFSLCCTYCLFVVLFFAPITLCFLHTEAFCIIFYSACVQRRLHVNFILFCFSVKKKCFFVMIINKKKTPERMR